MAESEIPESIDALVMKLATIALFLFLAGSLAYAYPQFLPAGPEQTVNRVLNSQQADCWGYVEANLLGAKERKYEYIRAAARCELLGYRARGDNLQRLLWNLDPSVTEAQLRVLEYYESKRDGSIIKVWTDYRLEKHGSQWFIVLDSILGDGGIDGYLQKRGVGPGEVRAARLE